MRKLRAATIAVLALSVASCSLTERPEHPTVMVSRIPVAAPPEARKSCLEFMPPKPTRDLTDAETFDDMATLRTGLRVCDTRRSAGVAAIDAAGGAK